MNIHNFDIKSYKQDFKPHKEYKELYGEVNTPFYIIQEMIENIPNKYLKNPNLKWLDPACGKGYYAMGLYTILMKTLQDKIISVKDRHNHILKNMIYMVEYNIENYKYLVEFFGNDANILNMDFLKLTQWKDFDIIIGNPPYNFNGLKKVPTNKTSQKTQDGITIWDEFIKHSIYLLKPDGLLSFIVPSIWMKPDKMKMYQYMLSYKIHTIKSYTNTETKKIFKGQAQTPTCYFLLQKCQPDNILQLYNHHNNIYENYHIQDYKPIPLFGSNIINKVMKITNKFGNIKVQKTNLPSKFNNISNTYHETLFPFKNIKTVHNKNNIPKLVLQYSDKPCKYYGCEKLILGHKMYGFPYYDISGSYGISNRDNYVIILNEGNREKYIKLQQFLTTDIIMFIYETTRYRMKYLEKYAFEFIPDITSLQLPSIINNEYTYQLFDFTNEEIQYINTFSKNNYNWFI